MGNGYMGCINDKKVLLAVLKMIHIFFYKHNVYKHIQAEILHFFQRNAKHIPALDFGYILVYWYISIYIIIINKHIAKHISA